MGCQPSQIHTKIQAVGKKFMEDPAVKKIFSNPSILVVKKFEQLFGYHPKEWKIWQPRQSDVRKFKGELNYVLKQIKKGKTAGTAASLFYTKSGVARRNPLLASLQDNFMRVNHKLKGRQIVNDNDFKQLLSYLGDESILRDVNITSRSLKKSRQRLDTIEKEITAAMIDVENKVPGAEKNLAMKVEELDVHLAKGEGVVFKEFIEILEKDNGLRGVKKVQEIIVKRKGKHLTDDNIRDIKKAIINSGIAKSPNMQNALSLYVDMTHSMHRTLVRGIEAYIDGQIEGTIAKGMTDTAQLERIKQKMIDEFSVDEKVGYYPHYRYDLQSRYLDGVMPILQKLSETTEIGSTKSIAEVIDELETRVTERIKPRTKNLNDKNYSMNFAVNVKRYMDEISRFNYVAFTQKYTKEVLREASQAFKKGKDLEGYGSDTVELIRDLNEAQLGTKEIDSPTFNNWSRAILNLEFVSKLGLNVRSALRNASQSLLNMVEFGPTMYIKSRLFYRTNRELERAADQAMEESGIKFTEGTPELIEIGGKGVFSADVVMGDNSKLTFTKPSKIGQFADWTGKAAAWTGKAPPFFNMMNIENLNRKGTYRLAFFKMYTELNKSPQYREHLREIKKRDITEADVLDDIKRRSKRYAENMTTLLHFDYSAISKSKLLTSKPGRFFFQFQHYAHKFAEYNFKIGRDARHGMMSGEFGFSGDVGKAYRMGIAYYAVPALLGALFKTDFSRMIQHDSADKIAQWWTFFTGDEEDFKKVTYGRGAIGAMIGAPAFSDFLALGELAELWDLDDNFFLKLAVGYNDMSDTSDDIKIKKLSKILNSQVGRTFYDTGSMALDGHWSRALQFEAGLYPFSEKQAREKREKLGVVVPDAVYDALDYIGDHIKRANKRSGKKKKKRKSRSAAF